MTFTKCWHILLLLLAFPLSAQEQCETLPPATDVECPYAQSTQNEAMGVARCWHIYKSDPKISGHAALCRANLRKAKLAGADLGEADLHQADLIGANLSGAYLSEANLRGASLSEADLSGATLLIADLRKADLSEAKLRESKLSGADLRQASLWNADLSRADLSGANLSEADLRAANLSEANLSGADLSGAYLPDATLYRATYEPAAGKEPSVDTISGANGLETLVYEHPRALVVLRNMFKDAGYREQERQVTYALKHGEIVNGKGELRLSLTSLIQYVMFDLTTEWGLRPERALILLLGLIPIFAVPYSLALLAPKRDGLWRVWLDKRVREDLGGQKPELITARFPEAMWLGFYFSLMSAFHIGWRDINVGNWISRLQPREYTLQASGWVRSASGIQSLISVYLFALWVLTYFGRPFV